MSLFCYRLAIRDACNTSHLGCKTPPSGGMWGAKAGFQGVKGGFVAIFMKPACDWRAGNRRHLTTRACVINLDRTDMPFRVLVLAACPMPVLAASRDQMQVDVWRARICSVTPSMRILVAIIKWRAGV